MQPAVRVDKLSKLYHLENGPQYERNLQESLAHGARTFLRKLTGRARQGMRDFWALRDVSFEIRPGEVVGIIGRNGAGKSTLLKILSRITEPTAGRAELRGRLGSLLEVGTGFHPELTGRENIYLNGSFLGMSRTEIRREFDRIVEFADIPGFLDTPVKRYSSGMYVRLAFAIAAHLHPEILVLDEVLAVGDAQFQQKCLGKMRDVSHDGRTVLFVSHDLAAVRRLCSRAILMSQGKIVAQGHTDEVVTRYLADESSLLLPDQRFDLANVRRQGSGKARFTALSLPAELVVSNGPMIVNLEIDSDSPRDIDSLSVILFDRSGVKLLNADTMILNKTIHLTAGTNRLRVRLERVPLNPGVYTLGLWMAKRPVTVFDYIEAVCDVEVHAPPGEPRLQPNMDGVVWTEFQVIEDSRY